ncbi:hypothetical protein GOODEAATRI_031216 [Goodea atripinnis]|uniref:Secreted protein n=1 Tax=Goodea atripinnis TaxID=208336 RepID=A0ABV0PTD5_9TELE
MFLFFSHFACFCICNFLHNLCFLHNLLLHHFTPPKSNTMLTSTTTAFWFYSNSTLSIFMISRTSGTSPFSFAHFSNMSKFLTVEKSHWFRHKLPSTKAYQAKENLLWHFLSCKLNQHSLRFNFLWAFCHSSCSF